MKILLDESIPRKLRNDFGEGHEVWTVRDKGWLGKKNGELLKLISEAAFELFITVDQNLQYQQNLESFSLTIIVLCGSDNRRETLKKLIPNMFVKLESGEIHSVIEVY
jgi:predicted nuclease of predicted toxin-antitoxin system